MLLVQMKPGEDLEEIVEFKDPRKFTRLGGKSPKEFCWLTSRQANLWERQPPESWLPFFSISGSDFVEMFVGVGASRVRDLFEQGKEKALYYLHR